MVIFEKVKEKFLLVLLFILIIPTFSSLLRPGYFPMHDDMQAMRLLQLDKCLKDWQIPCRWVPDMGYGYGYPQFNYYAPLPYYIMEAFHLLGFGFLDSVKAGFIASTIVGALGMYLLAKFLWRSAGGFISSFFYIYAPYRATDFYVRGAVGELWALSFMPFIFLFSARCLEGEKKYIIYFALSLAALLTSHNVSAVIFIPVLILWVIFLMWYKKDEAPLLISKIINFLNGFFWGFIISSFFILPAWFERNLVHVETLVGGYFNYINHFLGLSQILFETQWGYGTSEVGPFDDILLSVGLIQWLLPLTTIILLIILKKNKLAYLVSFLTILGWAALFMLHPRSSFVWSRVNFLAILQFPWRFLVIAIFLFSIATGAINLLFNKKTAGSKLTFAILMLVGFMLARTYFNPRIWISITDAEKFSGDSWQRQQTISIFDYLPIYARKPPANRAPEKPETVDGQVISIEGEKGSNWQTWRVNVESEVASLQLPIYYFPNWKVFVDDAEIPIRYDNELGLITISLDTGNHKVRAELKNTPVRNIGNSLTLIGLLGIPFYLRKKGKK